jgi:hypothetical protein
VLHRPVSRGRTRGVPDSTMRSCSKKTRSHRFNV